MFAITTASTRHGMAWEKKGSAKCKQNRPTKSRTHTHTLAAKQDVKAYESVCSFIICSLFCLCRKWREKRKLEKKHCYDKCGKNNVITRGFPLSLSSLSQINHFRRTLTVLREMNLSQIHLHSNGHASLRDLSSTMFLKKEIFSLPLSEKYLAKNSKSFCILVFVIGPLLTIFLEVMCQNKPFTTFDFLLAFCVTSGLLTSLRRLTHLHTSLFSSSSSSRFCSTRHLSSF